MITTLVYQGLIRKYTCIYNVTVSVIIPLERIADVIQLKMKMKMR